jgi:hypothetical protein
MPLLVTIYVALLQGLPPGRECGVATPAVAWIGSTVPEYSLHDNQFVEPNDHCMLYLVGRNSPQHVRQADQSEMFIRCRKIL